MNYKLRICAAITVLISLLTLFCADIPRKTLIKKYAGKNSSFIEIDGMNVHYRDEGKGEVLLMLHGMLSSLHTWDGWVEKMKGSYRMIRLDLPAFGLTGEAKKWKTTKYGKYVRKHYVAFIKKFMDALDIKRASIAGNSIGGYIAWSFAVFHSERVEKLVLIDTVAYPEDTPLAVDLIAAPVIGSIATVITPRFAYTINVKEVYYDDDKISDTIIDRYYELSMAPGNRKANRELLIELKRNSVLEPKDIGKIKAPTLIMWGKEDPWINVGQTKRWAKDLPSAEIIIYEKAGHMPMEELPVRTARDAVSFLGK